jgi:hypothetical protein
MFALHTAMRVMPAPRGQGPLAHVEMLPHLLYPKPTLPQDTVGRCVDMSIN